LETEERGSVGRPASGGFQRERLDRALARASDAPLREGNRLELLRNGPDTYEDWLAAISGAERWVHLDNYIFSDDEVGERFARALIRKAEEGVSVRVLYDWFGCLDVARSFWRRMREAGVDVRAVNPPTLGGPLGAIRRDHRKLLAVDGEYASTGGVCISDGWLVTSPETGLPYRDTAVGIRGPAVAYFLSMAILSQSLMSVARDGVDVRVLVPATNDLPWIGALSRTGYRQFLEAGVRIFEYGGPMIHAKTLVADGWWSKVGSTNLNVASLVANR
jgi:phosphatidylserine/phosphatidylglycerophosphate/cardiolipin synthase-like enzyme